MFGVVIILYFQRVRCVSCGRWYSLLTESNDLVLISQRKIRWLLLGLVHLLHELLLDNFREILLKILHSWHQASIIDRGWI